MKRFPIPGLTKGEREVFEQVAAGNATLAGVFKPKSVEKLVKKGLLIQRGSQVICRDQFGVVSVPTYEVPLPAHIVWCEWCAEQPDEEAT